MSYASANDLIVRFGEDELIQLTDRDGAGSFDLSALNAVLDEQSAFIDGYLRGRYALPILPAPKQLCGLCGDLARYALYADAAPPIVKDRHDAALAQLRDLAAGRSRLDVLLPPPLPAGRVVVTSGDRLFTRDSR